MAVHQAAGLDEGNRGQSVVGDVVVEVERVLHVVGAGVGAGHDLKIVLERVADVAVLVGGFADGAVIELVGIGDVVVPLIAVILPGAAWC